MRLRKQRYSFFSNRFNNNIKKVIMISVVEAITDTNVGGAGRLLLNRIKNSNNNEFKYTVLLPRGSALIPLLKDANIDFFASY